MWKIAPTAPRKALQEGPERGFLGTFSTFFNFFDFFENFQKSQNGLSEVEILPQMDEFKYRRIRQIELI